MVATAAPKIARHAAPSTWTKAQRAELEKRLAAVGTTITELSDARELMGFPRLSDSSDWDRANCHLNVGSPECQTALAQVRSCRAWLDEQLTKLPAEKVRRARYLLEIDRKRSLRLGELSALVGLASQLAEEPRRYGATFHKVYTEEELFGG
jgi:hypothetical protein